MKKNWLILVFGALFILSLAPANLVAAEQGIVYQEEVTSEYDVNYTVTFFDNMSVKVDAVNRGRYSRDTLYSFSIDLTRSVYENMTLSPGQSKTLVHDLSKMPNPMKTEQEVLFAIVGPNIEYTYNRTINADDSDDVLMAEISDVSVEPASEGDGTEAVVTVNDPSPHMYQMTLVLHSEKTHRKLGHPTEEQNGTYVARIPLNEEPGKHVRGEIRLYSDEIFEENSTMDMVEFEGKTNGSTSVTKTEFEQIDDPGGYYFGQEETEDENELTVVDDDGITNLGIAAGMLGVGTVLLISIVGIGIRRRLG